MHKRPTTVPHNLDRTSGSGPRRVRMVGVSDPTPDELRAYLPESARDAISVHVERSYDDTGIMVRAEITINAMILITDEAVRDVGPDVLYPGVMHSLCGELKRVAADWSQT